jgi:hypothetical protein
MKSPTPFVIKHRNVILGVAVAISLPLAMIALIISSPSNEPRSNPPKVKKELAPSLSKQHPPLCNPLAADALMDAPSATNAFSPPADGHSWDEKTASQLSERLAILSTGPLEHMLDFVQSLPEGDFKTTAWLQTLQTIAASSQGTTLLENALDKTPPELHEQAWGVIAEGYASHDPAAAMLWTASIPDPIARESCAQMVATRWGALEPAAAMAWLEQQPADEHWEPLLQTIVASWASTQPAEAMEWAVKQSQLDADTALPSLKELVTSVIQQDN